MTGLHIPQEPFGMGHPPLRLSSRFLLQMLSIHMRSFGGRVPGFTHAERMEMASFSDAVEAAAEGDLEALGEAMRGAETMARCSQ